MLRKARHIFESADTSLSPTTGPSGAANRLSHSLSVASRSSELDQEFATSPSTTTLECLFRSYSCRFEPYYPNFSAGVLDPMELINSDNKNASCLLLLLILAAGASATPTMEAGYLTNGLTESCRILLTDLTDNDISLWKNPTILRAALLSMNLAAWSGEKWHMDVSKSQSDLYLTMLRRSGLFAYRKNALPEFCGMLGTEVEWKKWKQHESMNRLVYSWVIADQELSLFHDQAPNLAITELTAALPDKDVLWQASSANSWSLALARVHDGTDLSQTRTPPSLYDLFKRLMSRDLLNESRDLTKLQLRLLLHPLQSLVCHLYQCLSCFAGDASSSHAQRLFVQIREVQSILQDWYALCCKRMRSVEEVCPILLSNLVMYHLVCLNTMTHFPDIEALARGEVSQEQFLSTSWARTNSVGSASRIWFHLGQIVRLVRMMPESNRPLWFPAVIYRVALILWMVSTCNNATQSPESAKSLTPFSDSMFAIDNMHPEHTSIQRYLQYSEGTPMLSTRKGVLVSLAVPSDTIMYACEVMKEEDFNTRLAVCIKNRLSHLAQRVKAASA
ncbi:uncharacterized protein BDZ99DRAFT_456822 [Mytilinidion resinicola]|uniref:Transcription factor domain-containing protein n=1 Tax=Mytilinidion resinicola TaxID=574789 RepID=A0A6A6Z7E4_9PEZI|nr:uncharacterized protein BDZ99DRAFT_456822 [Mytilinidion resinicola]KAF2817022.1 hypothetical protein BDZ99DRAFT_456822 [Mytilinidion resinicola]